MVDAQKLAQSAMRGQVNGSAQLVKKKEEGGVALAARTAQIQWR